MATSTPFRINTILINVHLFVNFLLTMLAFHILAWRVTLSFKQLLFWYSISHFSSCASYARPNDLLPSYYQTYSEIFPKHVDLHTTFYSTLKASIFTSYVDANFADECDWKSIADILYALHSFSISLVSPKQKVVALSTCKAEYLAASTAAL